MNSQKLLRLHDEPCLYFNEKKIHQALMSKTNAFMDLLERFYLAWQKNPGLVQMPKKQLFVTKGLKGDWRVMPCVIENFEGQTIKAVKVVGTNEEEKVVKDCEGHAHGATGAADDHGHALKDVAMHDVHVTV